MEKQTETLDKLYLEWSQFTGAVTEREATLIVRVEELKLNSVSLAPVHDSCRKVAER